MLSVVSSGESATWKAAFVTVTVTGADVAVLPAASRATAVRVCTPLTTANVFQAIVYGEAVTSTPRLAPSSLNCTPATPALSDAVAETAPAPLSAAPSTGAVRTTTGAWESGDTPVSTCEGTWTRKASSRPPPMLLVQMKYWPLPSRAAAWGLA